MTGRRRVTRILSALLLIAAPACGASAAEDPGPGSGFVDASKGDTSNTGTDSGTQDTSIGGNDTGGWDSTPIDNDTGAPGDDSGSGAVCTAACSTDNDCASACATFGGTWCCETTSSSCYSPSTGACQGTTTGDDGGSSSGGDSGTTGD